MGAFIFLGLICIGFCPLVWKKLLISTYLGMGHEWTRESAERFAFDVEENERLFPLSKNSYVIFVSIMVPIMLACLYFFN